MPRQARSFPPDATFHIISRGNRRQPIFEAEEDWGRFLKNLLTELDAESVMLLAFCLMPNHFHLVVRFLQDALSRALHRALTSHAAYMNKRYGRTGHLFEDRFQAYPCAPEGLLPLVAYVHRNPVRGKLVATADDWTWSSHRDYLDLSSPAPSGKAFVLSTVDKDIAIATDFYRSYMKGYEGGVFEKTGRPSLEALCAKVEREGGHVPNLIRTRSKRRDITGTRRRFIDAALKAGFKAVAIADFLGLAQSAISRYRDDLSANVNFRECP
ncbi:MAG: transposase [Elusimicrobia bacterium]|nr:transposase [Elusimicrobiota bacterium]